MGSTAIPEPDLEPESERNGRTAIRDAPTLLVEVLSRRGGPTGRPVFNLVDESGPIDSNDGCWEEKPLLDFRCRLKGR